MSVENLGFCCVKVFLAVLKLFSFHPRKIGFIHSWTKLENPSFEQKKSKQAQNHFRNVFTTCTSTGTGY